MLSIGIHPHSKKGEIVVFFFENNLIGNNFTLTNLKLKVCLLSPAVILMSSLILIVETKNQFLKMRSLST